MFLQSPYFSTEGAPGTPQGKILVRTLQYWKSNCGSFHQIEWNIKF